MQNSLSLIISLQNSLDISESLNIFENYLNKIKMQHFEHFNTSIAGHLNINSIRNKFEIIVETITNFDIFLISESKIDSTFNFCRNTRTRCEICSKLTIKIPERRQWRFSGIFIVNFEHNSHLVFVFLLLTLNMYLPAIL